MVVGDGWWWQHFVFFFLNCGKQVQHTQITITATDIHTHIQHNGFGLWKRAYRSRRKKKKTNNIKFANNWNWTVKKKLKQKWLKMENA